MRKLFSVCLAAVLSVSLFAPAVFAAENSALPEGFYGLERKISAVYVYDDTRMIAVKNTFWTGVPLGPDGGTIRESDPYKGLIRWHYDISYLTALKPKLMTGQLGKPITPIGSMDILLHDDTKYSYQFYENGLSVAKGMPGSPVGEPTYYTVDEQAYQTLLQSVRWAASVETADSVNPSWLMATRNSLATKLTIKTPQITHEWVPTDANFAGAMDSIRQCFNVEEDSMRAIKSTKLPKTGIFITIDFNTGVRYTIVLETMTLTIHSNNRDYALRYDLKYYMWHYIDFMVENPDVIGSPDKGKWGELPPYERPRE